MQYGVSFVTGNGMKLDFSKATKIQSHRYSMCQQLIGIFKCLCHGGIKENKVISGNREFELHYTQNERLIGATSMVGGGGTLFFNYRAYLTRASGSLPHSRLNMQLGVRCRGNTTYAWWCLSRTRLFQGLRMRRKEVRGLHA